MIAESFEREGFATERAEVKVVGFGGSLAEKSKSLYALKVAMRGAAEGEVNAELLDLRVLDLPMYHPDERIVPDVVQQMADTIYASQGLVWSSPTYHGSISGAFKNAIDWLQVLSKRQPPYLADKVVGLISTAGGVQGLQAVNTMEFIVRALRGLAIPLVVSVSRAAGMFDAEGHATDENVERQLLTLGREVARVASTMSAGSQLEKECAKARAALAVTAQGG